MLVRNFFHSSGGEVEEGQPLREVLLEPAHHGLVGGTDDLV
jgi:hypothetical protein